MTQAAAVEEERVVESVLCVQAARDARRWQPQQKCRSQPQAQRGSSLQVAANFAAEGRPPSFSVATQQLPCRAAVH